MSYSTGAWQCVGEGAERGERGESDIDLDVISFFVNLPYFSCRTNFITGILKPYLVDLVHDSRFSS